MIIVIQVYYIGQNLRGKQELHETRCYIYPYTFFINEPLKNKNEQKIHYHVKQKKQSNKGNQGKLRIPFN